LFICINYLYTKKVKMSLSTWSYPVFDDMKPMAKPTLDARKKINRATKFTPPPSPAMVSGTDDDDSSLADYTNEPAEQEPPQKEGVAAYQNAPFFKAPASEPRYVEPTFSEAPPDLSEKLDYMIRLLEEQRDEQTGHMTEEIILYLFLGIFIIFVLDSFVKTGRYSR